MSAEDQSHCGHPSTSRTDDNVEKFARLSFWIVIRPLTKFLNNRCVMEFMLSHFNGRFDDETVCCIIRAVCAHRGAKQQACKCLL